ncbi:MAG: hypothetical protein VKL60_20930 [Sphaerospermopsis sp.]|nr:hypothetical protein [Sphaerospermopsis sp.]
MLRIRAVNFYTQTRGLEPTNLYACIGEEVTVEVVLYSEIVTISTSDLKIWFKPPLSEVVVTTDNERLIKVSDSNFVNSLNIGDTIESVDITDPTSLTQGTWTVIEKLTSNIIRIQENFDPSIPNGNSWYGGDGRDEGYLINTTPFKYLSAKFGVTKGGFASPTTGETQSASIITSDQLSTIATTELDNIGGKEWQADILTVEGAGDGEGTEQNVVLTHTFIVTPLFLATELDDLIAGKIPVSWSNPLPKYNAEYEFAKTKELVNSSSRLSLSNQGTFGYFGKKYDGTAPNYTCSSLTFERISDSEVVSTLEYDNEVEVIATINRSVGSLHATDQVVIVGFNYLPQSEDYYINNGRTLKENFAFDSLKVVINDGPTNGINNGNANQIIKLAEVTSVDTDTFTVRIRIEFGANISPILRQDSEAWYNLWLISEDVSTSMPISDKSSILLQTNKLYEQLTTIDLFENDTVFIEHPYESTYFGQETLEMFPVDDVVANSYITCDYTGKESDNIKISSVEQLLVLTHATEADIILERNFINCENFPLVGSLPSIQDIDYVQDRPFQIPNGEIRKTIAFGRDYANDSGLVKAFGLSYPFMNRWEYWNKLEGVNNIPSSLFDASKDFKGINHFWNRLANASGWDLVYRTKFTIEQNGVSFQQEFDYALTSQDFNSNTDWSNCTIKSYDSVSNVEITASGTKYLDSAKYTKLVASFQKSTGAVPSSASDVAIVIWVMRFEAGTIADIYRLSSEYETGDDGILKSISGNGLVDVNKTSSTFTGSCYLDNTKIPQNTSKMTVYARIYEKSSTEFNVRITNDGKVRELLDASIRTIL